MADLLLVKSREGRIRWLNGLRHGEYIAGLENINLRISRNQGSPELTLIDENANRAGSATAEDGREMETTLTEIHALAEEQVRNRTIRKATEYLSDLDADKGAQEERETPRQGLRDRLPTWLAGRRRAREQT